MFSPKRPIDYNSSVTWVVFCRVTDDDMMTSSNVNIFRLTGHLCREFTDHRGIPCTKASDAALCDLRLNDRLSKLSWGWWLETPSRPLWRHSNEPFPEQ